MFLISSGISPGMSSEKEKRIGWQNGIRERTEKGRNYLIASSSDNKRQNEEGRQSKC